MKLSKMAAIVQWSALLFFLVEFTRSQSVSSSLPVLSSSLATTSASSPVLLTLHDPTPSSNPYSSASSLFSTTAVSILPTTSLASAESNTTSPTDASNNLCSNQSVVQKCINSFKNLYAFSPNDTHADGDLLGKLGCFGYVSKPNDSCIGEVPQSNCSVIRQALADNRTSFGVLCTASGELKQFNWASVTCQNQTLSLIRNIVDTTEAFCSSTINSSFVCNKTTSGFQVMSKNALLNILLSKNSCPAPTIPPIPLLPNPVGPAAMTAIVVLTVVAIICILAGFFFWPKCHISEDEIRLAEKKKRMKKKGKLNSAYAYTSATRPTAASYSAQYGGAKYDVEHGNVAVQAPRVPPTPGPPAA